MARDYVSLLTGQHRDKPLFVATVEELLRPLGALADLQTSMHTLFSVDEAVGVQLDQVGLWVGITRKQVIPIPDPFFAFDVSGRGWNQANWKGPYEPSEGVTTLDDATYRAVIKAKIGSNYWNGSMEDLQEIARTSMYDLGITCFVLDNLDMTATVYIIGAPSVVLIELIKRGITPPKAAGVHIDGYILSSEPGAPFFALSVDTTSEVAGLDFGSFGTPV